jgi:uncharacterized membrane protein
MTVLVILIIVAVAVFVAVKTGKVKDANNNNIPDAIEKPIEVVKEAVAEIKEVVEKAKKSTPKQEAPKAPAAKPAAKKPAAKTNAKKAK